MVKPTKKVLVAPLDWGLGHTTRCVPVIAYLLSQHIEVLIAGNATQLSFLSARFPGIPSIPLEGYNVHYNKGQSLLVWTLVPQMPRIFKAIKHEHKWLAQVISEHQVDAVISDNRYGLYSDIVPTVFMTHQLNIISGLGARADALIAKMHRRYIARFDACWVPDVADPENSLSGRLGKPDKHDKAAYIGWLSHMEAPEHVAEDNSVLVLLSGPEPQRSILSGLLWPLMLKQNSRVIFIEGTDACKPKTDIPHHITYIKRADSEELQYYLQAAGYVICRSGYSSLMDLLRLGKKAVIIPTPAQTEQEYLADYLHRKSVFMKVKQSDIEGTGWLVQMERFPFRTMPAENNFEIHKDSIRKWLSSCLHL